MHHVLFIHTGGGVGDLLLSSPILSAVKRRWPGARTTCWVDPRHAAILDAHPAVDACVAPPPVAADAIRAMRQGQFDAAILPWTTGREAWQAYRAGVPRRVGQSGRLFSSALLTDRIRVRSANGDVTSHWVDIQLDYARALGCDVEGLGPTLQVTDRDRRAAAALFTAHGVPNRPICGLHIGKGLPLSLARWPIDRFVDIGRRLCGDLGFHVVLTGSEAEREVVAAVAAGIGEGATSLAGATDLRTLCGVIAACAMVVSMDSGPMHLAAALDVPVVGIFPLRTDLPARWRPWSAAHRVVRSPARRCRPNCTKERCPRFDCLEEIDAAEVIAAAAGLMPRAERAHG